MVPCSACRRVCVHPHLPPFRAAFRGRERPRGVSGTPSHGHPLSFGRIEDVGGVVCQGVVFNNGSAGMPNFAGTAFGAPPAFSRETPTFRHRARSLLPRRPSPPSAPTRTPPGRARTVFVTRSVIRSGAGAGRAGAERAGLTRPHHPRLRRANPPARLALRCNPRPPADCPVKVSSSCSTRAACMKHEA